MIELYLGAKEPNPRPKDVRRPIPTPPPPPPVPQQPSVIMPVQPIIIILKQ